MRSEPLALLRIYGSMMKVHALRVVSLLAFYTVATLGTLWLAYQLRFDFRVPPEFSQAMLDDLTWFLPLKLLALVLLGQFATSLSYFSTPDVRRIVGACGLGSALIFAVKLAGGPSVGPPRGVILTDGVLSCALLCFWRVSLRYIRETYLAPQTRADGSIRRVGIVGAGDAGAALVRELFNNRWMGLRPIAFFDDGRRVGSRLHGVPVWGGPEKLLDRKIGLKLDEVIIALPSAAAARLREVVAILQKSKLPFRTIPSMTELAMGTGEVSNLRPVQIEDLLGRDEVKIDLAHIREMIEDRVIMVTGAGGSIGSELCRQIASFAPQALLLVERSEAALFPIEQELAERGFHHFLVPLVADVTHEPTMRKIFSAYRPHLVFHAAAHKHVPMMEGQPAEAIRNNVLGTALVARLAAEYRSERFVLVSTDKAVNPTNVMGATKRLAEVTVQALNASDPIHTRMTAVRFGNVLGSSGSVVPTFTRQIAAGGPVTVTHPDVTRFFMTIPEAVSLVLQSASQAQGGEIFVLDMGQPVKILDLARQMIELSGRRVDEDIRIEFTGLRPGEKLYEELSHCGESVEGTDHPRIRRLRSFAERLETVHTMLAVLAERIAADEPAQLKAVLQKYVPEYQPPEASGEAAEPPTPMLPPPDSSSGHSSVVAVA